MLEKILNLSGIIRDDEISEAEEAFVLYTDTSESAADDVSAIVVYIQDNDCKTTYFHILLPAQSCINLHNGMHALHAIAH